MKLDQREYAENLYLLGYTPDKVRESMLWKLQKDGPDSGGGDIPIKEILIVIAELETRLVKEINTMGDDLSVAKAIRRMQIIYMKSFAIQDFKTCLGIQKEINRLLE